MKLYRCVREGVNPIEAQHQTHHIKNFEDYKKTNATSFESWPPSYATIMLEGIQYKLANHDYEFGYGIWVFLGYPTVSTLYHWLNHIPNVTLLGHQLDVRNDKLLLGADESSFPQTKNLVSLKDSTVETAYIPKKILDQLDIVISREEALDRFAYDPNEDNYPTL